MKKLFTTILTAAAIFGSVTYSHAAGDPFVPENGKTYLIEHRSGFYMTVSDGSMKILPQSADALQGFTINAVEGEEAVYTIKDQQGKYIGSDGQWTVVFADAASSSNYQFTFPASHEAGYYLLHVVGTNKNFGCDSNSSGSGVYSDKGGNDGKHLWRFILVDLEAVIAEANAWLSEEKDATLFPTDAANLLKNAINNAQEKVGTAAAVGTSLELKALLNAMKAMYTSLTEADDLNEATYVGEEFGDCTQSAKDAFSAAIEAAKNAWKNADTASIEAANSALTAAISTFKANILQFVPDSDKVYTIANVAKNLSLTAIPAEGDANANFKILALEAENNAQRFTFVPVEGKLNVYKIKLYGTSEYYGLRGDWNSNIVDEQNAAEVTFEQCGWNETANCPQYYLKEAKGLMGVDEGDPIVYTNKGTWQNNITWQVNDKDGYPISIVTYKSFTEVTSNRAGELKNLLGKYVNKVDSLKIVGPINDADFNTLKTSTCMGQLVYLDLKDATVESGQIPADAFYTEDAEHPAQLKDIILPSTITKIGADALSGLKISSIVLPETLTVIADNAFANTLIKNLNVPGSVRAIGNGAFADCSELDSLTVASGLEMIGESVFFNCSNLKYVYLPNTVKSLGAASFAGLKSLEKIYCDAMDAPTCITSSDSPFTSDDADLNDETNKAATVYVPTDCGQKYKDSEIWKYFTNIVEDAGLPSSGVESVAVDDVKVNVLYDLNGRVISEPVSGQAYICNGKVYIRK